jgi:hypothetical protein
LTVDQSVVHQVVEDDVDATSRDRRDGVLKSEVQPHKFGAALDHAVFDEETVGTVHHVNRQQPNEYVDADK